MSMSAWHVDVNGNHEPIILGPNDELIATCDLFKGTGDHKRHAWLIAASPFLLESLRKMVTEAKAVAYRSYRIPGAADALPGVATRSLSEKGIPWITLWANEEPEWFEVVKEAETALYLATREDQ